jgi:trehalose synthase
MPRTLAAYEPIIGSFAVSQLKQLAGALRGARVVHVNSTRVGGGVAEILDWLVDLMNDLGLHASWEVLEGSDPFFRVTKAIHNGLQGHPQTLGQAMQAAYQAAQETNAERLRPRLEEADFVIIHDPQPAGLLALCPGRKGKWIWRCHIDASRPDRGVWRFVRERVMGYDASVFSMPEFAQPLPHPQFIIAPSIDPLSDKNCDLSQDEIDTHCHRLGLRPGPPLITQVSRFDRFKDPVGVIRAFRLVRESVEAQLVLAGGGASDDPEGEAVLAEVHEAASGHPDIHVLLLPGDAHRTINALQRASALVVQKSLQEGFGLTVTEALWKGKPVIGGNVGGIRLQVHNRHTGYLVDTPEGAALRLRELIRRPELREAMGRTARRFVTSYFLLDRHLREYLTLMLGLQRGLTNRLLAHPSEN